MSFGLGIKAALRRGRHRGASRALRRSAAQIYETHVQYVWRALIHLGVHEQDIEDVAHEVFITVYRRLPRFEGRSSLRTWIYGICLRTASGYRRRAFRRREVSTGTAAERPGSSNPETAAREALLRERLTRLLDGLKPAQREVFVLFEIEELPMKEVARAIGCPLQTAYSRLHAARATLKKNLAAQGITP